MSDDWKIKCSCGHVFDGHHAPARPAKDQEGNFLDEDVAQNSTTGSGAKYERQCPACLLWFDELDDPFTEAIE